MPLNFVNLNAITSPSGIISDGGGRDIASAYRSVAQSARGISDLLRKREEERGKQQALADFNSGETREGRITDIFSVEDESYKVALSALTLSRAEDDVENELDVLAEKFAGDPEGFEKAAAAFKSGYLEEAPVEGVKTIEALINRKASVHLTETRVEQERQTREAAQQAVDARISRKERELSALIEAGGLEALQTDEFRRLAAELEDLLDIKQSDTTRPYTDDQRQLDTDDFSLSLQVSAVKPDIQEVFDRRGLAAALDAVDEITDEMGFDASRKLAFESALRNEVNLLAQNENARRAERERSEALAKKAAKQEADSIERAANVLIFDPNTTVEDKLAFLNDNADALDPSAYRTLANKATSGDSSGVPTNIMVHHRRAAYRGNLTTDDLAELPVSESQRKELSSIIEGGQEARIKPGTRIIDAAFKQNGFFDKFNNQLAVQGEEALIQLQDYVRDNPEATTEQVTNAAREIALNYRRGIDVRSYSSVLRPTVRTQGGEDYDEAAFIRAEDRIAEMIEQGDPAAAEEARRLERLREFYLQVPQ